MSDCRRLPLQHARRLLSPKPLSDTTLLPGEAQLNSYRLPSLEGGLHSLTITQSISCSTAPSPTPSIPPSEDTPITRSTIQQFTVVAPQFSLPAGTVDSVYPPPGHGAEAKVLPHVVFNDPYLPWERRASKMKPADVEKGRNCVPWLALLVFTPEELVLRQEELWGILPVDAPLNMAQLGETMALELPVDMVRKLRGIAKPFKPEKEKEGDKDKDKDKEKEKEKDEEKELTQMVFLPSGLFSALFPASSADAHKPDVTQYRFLSHVRRVNTQGMALSHPKTGSNPVSGPSMQAEAPDDSKTFSIVVSPRVGPLDQPQAVPVIVHLVSLEGIEDNITLPIPDTQRVGLVSLHSWTYSSLPPESFSDFHALQHLGNELQFLRAPPSPKLPDDAPPEDKLVQQRLDDGFTLVKHHTVTGELTAALLRGPLTPTTVPHPLTAGFARQSTFGTDLQILDPDLGLMDISYDAAWQLGRTLALADAPFVAALGRLRTAMTKHSRNAAKVEVLRKLGGYSSRDETVHGLLHTVQRLNAVHGQVQATGLTGRWKRSLVQPVDLSYRSAHIRPRMVAHMAAAARVLASSPDNGGGGLYNELNTPSSSDWALVFSWVQDRLFLRNVPAHYLIPDPSFLPRESLRFFHIDANWVDALVDGALSLANHLDRADDMARAEIKRVLNLHLESELAGLGYTPQVPGFGFLLRSEVLSRYPDLCVTSELADGAKGAAVLRLERLEKDVMFCLLDCAPPKLTALSFSLPPHQQAFAVGTELSPKKLDVSYKRIFTAPPPGSGDGGRHTPLSQETWPSESKQSARIFNWGSRTLSLPGYVDYVRENLRERLKDAFTDETSTSALLALQLNAPLYILQILLKKGACPEKPSTSSGIIGGDAPRILKFLPPSTPDLAPASLPEPPAPAIFIPLPAHGHRFRPRPHPPLGPSPHHAPLRFHTAKHRAQPVPKILAPAYRPYFAVKAYAIDTEGYIPTCRGIPQDLVFSVLLEDGAASAFHLVMLELLVPIGDGKPNPSSNSAKLKAEEGKGAKEMGEDKEEGTRENTDEGSITLMKTHHGPPPSMLSNLRFNVLAQPDEAYLHIFILPRSSSTPDVVGPPSDLSPTTGPRTKEEDGERPNVPVGSCGEVSFLLPLCRIREYAQKRTLKLQLRSYYLESADEKRKDGSKGGLRPFEDEYEVVLMPDQPKPVPVPEPEPPTPELKPDPAPVPVPSQTGRRMSEEDGVLVYGPEDSDGSEWEVVDGKRASIIRQRKS